MNDLKKVEYKGYFIYFYEENYLIVAKMFVDNKYNVEEIYKKTKRNYVAKIVINNEKFIIKSPKSETILPQKKLLGIIKKGESLTTLINLNEHINNGIDNYVKPYATIIKKNIFLKESFLLMENIEGQKIADIPDSNKILDEILEVVKKIHQKKIYHGDLNTSNFLYLDNKVKIIDTQGKKDIFSNFKRAYDYLTLKEDLLIILKKYNIEHIYRLNKRTIGYLLAYIIKSVKRNKIIKKFRNLKKRLRRAGWKI